MHQHENPVRGEMLAFTVNAELSQKIKAISAYLRKSLSVFRRCGK